MRKTLAAVLLLGIILQQVPASPLLAADIISTWYSEGQLNGRFWNELSEYSKGSFVAGMWEGIRFCSEIEPTYEDLNIDLETVKTIHKALTVFIPSRMAIKEVIAYLDKFYSDPLNVNIPVGDAYGLMLAQHGGWNVTGAKTYEEAIIFFRRRYNK